MSKFVYSLLRVALGLLLELALHFFHVVFVHFAHLFAHLLDVVLSVSVVLRVLVVRVFAVLLTVV